MLEMQRIGILESGEKCRSPYYIKPLANKGVEMAVPYRTSLRLQNIQQYRLLLHFRFQALNMPLGYAVNFGL
jgi:hypothetical protein